MSRSNRSDNSQGVGQLALCSNSVSPMTEAAEMHKPPTIAVTVAKTMLPDHMSEKVAVRAHLDIRSPITITMQPLGGAMGVYLVSTVRNDAARIRACYRLSFQSKKAHCHKCTKGRGILSAVPLPHLAYAQDIQHAHAPETNHSQWFSP